MRRGDQGGDVRAAERESRAADLRADGLTFDEIAREMQVAKSTAHRLVARGLHRVVAESVQHYRGIELRHLERMRRGLVKAGANDGDPKAVLAAIKVADRVARLLGLDAPTKLQATVTGGLRDMTDGELLQLRATLGGP